MNQEFKEGNARESLAAQWREWLESFGDQSHSGIKASAALAEIERLNRALSEAVRDAERWHKARRYLAIEDVAGWGGPDWRGHDPDEDESVKADRAIDALP